MEDNLVRLLQGSIDEYGVSALARQLGHGEGEIGSALSIVIPTFVSGLAHKALTRGGAAEIRSAMDAADERLLTDVPATIEHERTRLMDEGSALLNLVFGDKLSGVQANIGSSTGLGKGGTASLMRMHAPFAMAAVARHYRGRIRGDRELARELAAEGALAEAFLPRSLAPLLAAEIPRPAAEPSPRVSSTARRREVTPASPHAFGATPAGGDPGRDRGPGRFLIPAAIGAAILAAVLMFVGPRDRGEDRALLGRPGGDEGAGLLGGEAREDMERAGEEIREETREAADEGRELGTEAEEALREAGRTLEQGTEKVGERIGEAWESTERAVEEGVEDLERTAEEAAREAEEGVEGAARETEEAVEGAAEEAEREGAEEGREVEEAIEGEARTLSFETSRFFEGQALELREDSQEAIDEIVDEYAERRSDSVTLRGPNPSQLDSISDALAERGVTGIGKEVDGSLDHIEVRFER